jgi:hypothetical protein
MPSLFNPYVLLAFVFTIFGAFAGGYYTGENDEQERQQIEIAGLNTKAREAEQRMADVAQTYATTFRNAQNVAKAKETKLRADVATSTLRLSIPTQSPVCPATDTTLAAGDSRETRAELDRSVAEALIAITADGDAAIRKLNACIDTYEKMRSMR